jgi:hypothetical protein
VDPRAGPNGVEKRKFLAQLGLELQALGRPSRSQSLYRLRYPRSQVLLWLTKLSIYVPEILNFQYILRKCTQNCLLVLVSLKSSKIT